MTPDKLGAFKIEDRGTAIIKGRKRYFMNNKAKISGLQKRITMNEKTFSDNTMTTTRAIGIRDGLRANRTDTIGTFRRVQFDMNGIDIDSLPLPKIIDEREHYT
jgi:hypothetical protein